LIVDLPGVGDDQRLLEWQLRPATGVHGGGRLLPLRATGNNCNDNNDNNDNNRYVYTGTTE
jgi:hypothetical protein